MRNFSVVISFCLTTGILFGCGTNKQNPVISQLPTKEQNQITTIVNHAANIYLPTWIPFTPTHGYASATTPQGRNLSQQVTITFKNDTEILILKEPDNSDLVPPNPNVPGTVKLGDGSSVAYQVTKKWSQLSWYNEKGSYMLLSSKISSGIQSSPDLNERELMKIAELVK